MAKYYRHEEKRDCVHCKLEFSKRESVTEGYQITCPRCNESWYEKDIVVRVRTGGKTPIKPFTVTGTL